MLHASWIWSIVSHYIESGAQSQTLQCQKIPSKARNLDFGKPSQHSHVAAVIRVKLGNRETTCHVLLPDAMGSIITLQLMCGAAAAK